MKYLSKNQLSELINGLQVSRDKIRAVVAKYKKDLATLNAATVDVTTGRAYTEAEKVVMRAELKKKAMGSVPGSSLDVENKIIGKQKAFWSDSFFDSVPLHENPNQAAECMERLWLAKRYELASASQFIQMLHEAKEDGRAAELGVARLVLESRQWRSLEEQRDISAALHSAERDVVYEDRTKSLELLDVASNLYEDCESSLSALRSDQEDIRLKAAPYIEARLKRESAAQE